LAAGTRWGSLSDLVDLAAVEGCIGEMEGEEGKNKREWVTGGKDIVTPLFIVCLQFNNWADNTCVLWCAQKADFW